MSLFVLLPESFAVILGSKEEKSILYILPLSYDDLKIDRIEVASARVSEGELNSVKEISSWAKKNSIIESIEVLTFIDEGKSIQAIISYKDAQGFDEIVTTSAASIPYVDDGIASFSIKGTAAVGNTLSINEDSADPDGTGTLSYKWQTSSDNSNWKVVGTIST